MAIPKIKGMATQCYTAYLLPDAGRQDDDKQYENN